MGGSKLPTIIAPLCHIAHEKITLHEWGNAVLELPDGGRLYRIWNLKNETILERVLSGSGQESQTESVEMIDEETSHPAGTLRTSAGEVLPLVSPAEGLVRTPSRAFLRARLEHEAELWAGTPVIKTDLAQETGNLLHLSEEELALYYAQALQRSGEYYIEACRAVAEYARRARAAGEENWTEAATTLFNASRRTLQRMAQVYTAVTEAISAPALAVHEAEVMALPTGTLQLLAQAPAEQREAAFLAALGHQATYSEASPAGVAHALRRDGILPPADVRQGTCPACGHMAEIGEFRRKDSRHGR